MVPYIGIPCKGILVLAIVYRCTYSFTFEVIEEFWGLYYQHFRGGVCVTLHALLRYFLQIIWRSNEPQVSMLGV